MVIRSPHLAFVLLLPALLISVAACGDADDDDGGSNQSGQAIDGGGRLDGEADDAAVGTGTLDVAAPDDLVEDGSPEDTSLEDAGTPDASPTDTGSGDDTSVIFEDASDDDQVGGGDILDADLPPDLDETDVNLDLGPADNGISVEVRWTGPVTANLVVGAHAMTLMENFTVLDEYVTTNFDSSPTTLYLPQPSAEDFVTQPFGEGAAYVMYIFDDTNGDEVHSEGELYVGISVALLLLYNPAMDDPDVSGDGWLFYNTTGGSPEGPPISTGMDCVDLTVVQSVSIDVPINIEVVPDGFSTLAYNERTTTNPVLNGRPLDVQPEVVGERAQLVFDTPVTETSRLFPDAETGVSQGVEYLVAYTDENASTDYDTGDIAVAWLCNGAELISLHYFVANDSLKATITIVSLGFRPGWNLVDIGDVGPPLLITEDDEGLALSATDCALVE